MSGLSSALNRRRVARWSIIALVAGLLSFAITLPLSTKATLQSSAADSSGEQKLRRRAESVPGKIIVRYRSEAKALKGERTAALQSESLGAVPISIERFEGSNLVEGLRFARVAPEQTREAIAALNARPDVLYAEPDYVLVKEALPNDARFPEMWALRNTGPGQTTGGVAGDDIKAEQAWNITTGSSNVVVGIVDEGIDINHVDLAANIWTNPGEIPNNGIDDDGNGYVDDVNGWDFFHDDKTVFDGAGNFPVDQTDSHGTHVAGTIGAVGNNGTGVVGVNWNVKLMSLKFIGPSTGDTIDAIKAYNYAKTMRQLWESSGHTKGANVRVLNNSYGPSFITATGNYSQAASDAISALNSAGILFVAAAGNRNTNNDTIPAYPANYDFPNVISVAATTSADGLPSFSNVGLQKVQIGAPGVSILSTTPNNTYSVLSGTSMAAPHVSGAAALLCAAYPNLSVQQLRSLIIYNGDPIAALTGKTSTSNRLNAFNSLQAATDTMAPGTVSNFRITAQSGRTITLAWTASGDDGVSGTATAYNIELAEGSKKTALASVMPAASGTQQTITLNVPYRHAVGTINLREFDNAGNEGAPASVPYAVSASTVNPYQMSLGSPALLSIGGTPLGLNADDAYREDYQLPFTFPFFGQNYAKVTISTNGNLYFSTPPKRSNGDADDVPATVVGFTAAQGLIRYKMIAGMWDDLRAVSRELCVSGLVAQRAAIETIDVVACVLKFQLDKEGRADADAMIEDAAQVARHAVLRNLRAPVIKSALVRLAIEEV